MRPGRAVEKPGVQVVYGHVEDHDVLVALVVGEVSGVDGQRVGLLQRLAARALDALGDGVVPAAELELDNVAHSGDDKVGHDEILGAADYHGMDLACLAWRDCVGANCMGC